MQLGFVLFKTISGDIQTALGYQGFFGFVLLAALPVLLLALFVVPRLAAQAPAAEGQPAP